MNKLELILLVLAWVITQFCYKKVVGKKEDEHHYLFMVVSAICLFFSVNHLTQIVTVDEEQYMVAFSHLPTAMEKLYIGGGMSKSINEYRISQLLIGTIVSIFKSPIEKTGGFTLVLQLYKCIHWAWSYSLILFLVYIVDRYFFDNSIKCHLNKRQLSLTILYSVLVILPVNMLMNKVGNYDSLSVLFATIAILLCIVAIDNKNEKISYGAMFMVTIAAMEKSSATIFWPICFVLALLVNIQKNKMGLFLLQLKKLFIGSMKIVFMSIILSCCSLIIIFGITDKSNITELGIKLSISKVMFPFIYWVGPLISDDKFSIQEFELNNSIAIFLFVVILILIVTIGIHLIIEYFVRKSSQYSSFYKITSQVALFFYLSLLGGGGVFSISTAFQITPYAPIGVNEYPLMREAGGWGYHYGVESKFGYELANLLSHYGLFVTALPSVILFGGVIYYLLIQKKKSSEKILFKLSMLSAFLMPVCFAVVGVPSTSHRYYGTIINVWLILLSIFFINNYIATKNFDLYYIHKKCCAIVYLVLVLIVVELIPFYPNVTFFSPFWNSQKRELTSGYWHFNEPMLWGEDIAFAGEKILEIIGPDDPVKYAIYSNYGQKWYNNPGFKLNSIEAIKNEGLEFFDQKNVYISLSRFSLFRRDIPDFITEVEPVKKVNYKGITAVWIYRADQLKGYENYFFN